MTHSLQWPIHEWPIHLNDPFTSMTHSLKWPIHLNGPFTWMTHSAQNSAQLKIVLSTSYLIFLNISNLTWNFILNRFQSAQTSSSMLKLLFNSTEDEPFTWMAHSLQWPIQLKIVLSTSFFLLKYIKSNLKFHFKEVSECSDIIFYVKMLFNSTKDDPFTWMAHSLEWPWGCIITRMIHSAQNSAIN